MAYRGRLPTRRSLRLGGCSRGRSLPYNFQNGLPVLGAVVVDLLTKMRDKAARGQRDGAVRIELGASAHPPGSREDGDIPVIGMPVWMAHVMRGPFDQDNVQTRLRGIAGQHCHFRAGGSVGPMDLLRQFVDQRGWV